MYLLTHFFLDIAKLLQDPKIEKNYHITKTYVFSQYEPKKEHCYFLFVQERKTYFN